MSFSRYINISILLLLLISTFVVYLGLSSLISIITDVVLHKDIIFEYTVVYFISASFLALAFRLILSIFLLSPLQKVEHYVLHLNHITNEYKKINIPSIPKELDKLVQLIQTQDIELRELSMEFEKSVKISTCELNTEKEFAHKIIEKLSDIVFVIKDNILIHANNNFYNKFKDLDSFSTYSDDTSLVESLKNLEKTQKYLELGKQLFSVNIELFNSDCYIITLLDMTQYQQNIQFAQDQNPLTKLPGNESIKKYMYARLKKRDPVVIVYFDFDNFKPFNDKYGFELGDKMISSFAQILIAKENTYNLFNAHIGGDDFFCSAKEPFDTAISMVKEIITKFTLNAQELYSKEDRDNNYVVLKDRDGKSKKFPLLSVSAVVVNIAPHSKTFTYIELTQVIASMKKVSKMANNKLAAVSLIA